MADVVTAALPWLALVLFADLIIDVVIAAVLIRRSRK